jgi:hypothetical protein
MLSQKKPLVPLRSSLTPSARALVPSITEPTPAGVTPVNRALICSVVQLHHDRGTLRDIWGSSFNDGTTQTVRDPPLEGGPVRTQLRDICTHSTTIVLLVVALVAVMSRLFV